MPIDLHSLADEVDDEADFLSFLDALASDWNEAQELEAAEPSNPYARAALDWENLTLGAMLHAAARWGESSINGLQFYKKPTNPWRRAAHILLAGKFYE